MGKKDSNKDSSLSWYLDQINKIPLLSREEEDKYARLSQSGDEKAKEILIKSNLRFVVSIAKKYQTSGISLLDLINEGNMGLIKAAEKYDPDMGYHFISYAVWWIRQSILHAISQKVSLIRIPMNRSAELLKIENVHKNLENRLGREPSINEISEELDIVDSEIQHLKNISQNIISLDATINVGEDISMISTLEDTQSDSPDKQMFDDSLKKEIHTILKTLSKSEREILIMRYGLNGQQPLSLNEIGKKFKLSKERIRQIEIKALRRLRQPSKLNKLRSFIKE